MKETADVLIVGGGVIGCSLARELAGRGVRVTLLERGELGEEASTAAAGLLSPQAECEAPGPFFDLALESRNLYSGWACALEAETGIEVGYHKAGTLRCSFGEPEDERLFASLLWQRAAGLPVERLGRAEVEEHLEGRLSPEVREALFFPEDAIVHNGWLMRALRRAIEIRGARVLTGRRALSFRLENGACRGVETDAGPLEAGAVVDAAGAWAGFDSALPFAVPVEPVRGQIVELRSKDAPLPEVVQSRQVYLVPRPDGTLLAGATVEHAGFEKQVTAEAVAALTSAALRLVPSLKEASFSRAWAGLRPGTPDGLPLLGPCEVPGLFFAAGHFRNGILLAPVTALLLADLLTGARCPGLAPFSPKRFEQARATGRARENSFPGVFS